MHLREDRLVAFFLAATLVVVLIGTLTIAQDFSPALRDLLNSLTINHWSTKSVMIAALFPLLSGLFYFAFGNEKTRALLKADRIALWTAILILVTLVFMIVIFGFYALLYIGLM